jgi:hypothetical protein
MLQNGPRENGRCCSRVICIRTRGARGRRSPTAQIAATALPPFGSDTSPAAFRTVAFFDAYFSNFIEGTEFEVDEAREIVFNGVIPTARPADAHDVLGTFAIAGDASWMRHGTLQHDGFASFRERLREAHARILRERPDKRPGQFTQMANWAGDTRFVVPDLVEGIL